MDNRRKRRNERGKCMGRRSIVEVKSDKPKCMKCNSSGPNGCSKVTDLRYNSLYLTDFPLNHQPLCCPKEIEGKCHSFHTTINLKDCECCSRNTPCKKSHKSKDIKYHPRDDRVKVRSPRETGFILSPGEKAFH